MHRLIAIFSLLILLLACSTSNLDSDLQVCECPPASEAAAKHKGPLVMGGLLASRFNNMEELEAVIKIEYFNVPDDPETGDLSNSKVRISHCSHGKEVTSELATGISQENILEARDGDIWERIGLLINSPFAAAYRNEIVKVHNLARRKSKLFGEGDVAFYDLALGSVENLSTPELAYLFPRDSSEKGYINTFNHITAQALLTTFFSEEMADYISDVHERWNMPELITGKFKPEQLSHPDDNPVDNYVDMINNEWGQELGKQLKIKYKITQDTYWTPQLLTNYLNDLQMYYSWAFHIGFMPYEPDDSMIVRYAKKINTVMNGSHLEMLF